MSPLSVGRLRAARRGREIPPIARAQCLTTIKSKELKVPRNVSNTLTKPRVPQIRRGLSAEPEISSGIGVFANVKFQYIQEIEAQHSHFNITLLSIMNYKSCFDTEERGSWRATCRMSYLNL